MVEVVAKTFLAWVQETFAPGQKKKKTLDIYFQVTVTRKFI